LNLNFGFWIGYRATGAERLVLSEVEASRDMDFGLGINISPPLPHSLTPSLPHSLTPPKLALLTKNRVPKYVANPGYADQMLTNH
jgi:hypothetical protein